VCVGVFSPPNQKVGDGGTRKKGREREVEREREEEELVARSRVESRLRLNSGERPDVVLGFLGRALCVPPLDSIPPWL
jgi:hypothetical protein